MACISNALVLGGGLAGLSAAVALARVGVRCEVVEISGAWNGASLGVSGRAAEALVELGIYDEVYATGTPFNPESPRASQRDGDGRLISPGPQRPSWPGARTGVGVYRPVLLEILETTARGLGVELRTGLTAQTVENGEDATIVGFSDGSEGRFDLVVGADGIGSHTRRLLFPDAPSPAYSGQFSVRWMVPGPPIQDEAWYITDVGRLGFYALPGDVVYMVAVFAMPEWRRLGDAEVHALVERLFDACTAPAVKELQRRLTPESELICRPFEWILAPEWRRGRTVLIGDAAHATTAHMGMGGGMALEDAVVLAQCVASAATLDAALQAFMARRFERVRTVVEASVSMSRLEQESASPAQNMALMSTALQAISQPY